MKSSENSTEFPDDQKARLKELIPAYEAFILANNPDLKSHCNALTKWRNDTAKTLMKEDLFQQLLRDSELELKDWETAIRRFYTNHYNNVYLLALRRAAGPGSASRSSTSVSPSATPTANSKAINDVLQKAIVTFLGDLSAREMFASENETAIQQAMNKIRTDNPDSDLIGGGLRNKALKMLWKDADQELWKAKIKALAANIEANRVEFPSLMLQALQNLCNRDRLGSTLMSFSWAFRDRDNDGINGGMIFHGYDSYQPEEVTAKPQDHDAQLDAWLLHADSVLSRKPRSFTYKIPLNEDGIPALPQIPSDANPPQVAILLGDYLASLWEYSWSGEPQAPPFPWEGIAVNPSHYFDTSVFKLPCPLNPPKVLKNSETFQLHEYFSSLSDSEPFQFYSGKKLSKKPSDDNIIPTAILSPTLTLSPKPTSTSAESSLLSSSTPVFVKSGPVRNTTPSTPPPSVSTGSTNATLTSIDATSVSAIPAVVEGQLESRATSPMPSPLTLAAPVQQVSSGASSKTSTKHVASSEGVPSNFPVSAQAPTPKTLPLSSVPEVLGGEEVPLSVAASKAAPKKSRGRQKPKPKPKVKVNATQQDPQPMPAVAPVTNTPVAANTPANPEQAAPATAPSCLENNSTSVPTRKSTRVSGLKRKQQDVIENPKVDQEQPAKKKKKVYWRYVLEDQYGNIIEPEASKV